MTFDLVVSVYSAPFRLSRSERRKQIQKEGRRGQKGERKDSHEIASALGLVAAESLKLRGVDGATTVATDKRNDLKRVHSFLDQTNGDENRGTTEARDAMDTDRVGSLILDGRDGLEPRLDDGLGRKVPVLEDDVCDGNTGLCHARSVVCGLASADNMLDAEPSELADVQLDVIVVGCVKDDKLEVVCLDDARRVWKKASGHLFFVVVAAVVVVAVPRSVFCVL